MSAAAKNLAWTIDAEGRLEECERLVRVNLELAERAVRAWREEERRIEADAVAARAAKEMRLNAPIAWGSRVIANGQHIAAMTRFHCAQELALALALPGDWTTPFDVWAATVTDAV